MKGTERQSSTIFEPSPLQKPLELEEEWVPEDEMKVSEEEWVLEDESGIPEEDWTPEG